MRHDNYMDGYFATSFTTQADVAYTRRRGPGAGSLRPPQTYPPSASQESTRRRRVILRIGGTGNRNRARSRSQALQVNPRCWVNVARSPRCRHSHRTQWVCSALNHAKLWAVGLVRSLQSLCLLISVVRVHGRVRYGQPSSPVLPLPDDDMLWWFLRSAAYKIH